ncbi:MAG: conjugal transfer protein TraC, partial [Oscillospiraceae bacterium]|nr:conjugal transfer protein TraC [Oscillospiraceae bacterium]
MSKGLFSDDKTADSERLYDGVPTLKDMMAPSCFRRDAFDYLGVGDRYVRSFFLAGYPRQVSIGWADKLFNYNGDLDMVIHINPMEVRSALDELTDKITQYEAQFDIESEKGSNRNVTNLRNKITELYREREKLEQNYISMFKVQMLANMYTKSVEQLDKETDMLDNSLRGQKIKIVPLHLRQDQGYKSCMPFGKSWLPKNFRNFSSEGLTA